MTDRGWHEKVEAIMNAGLPSVTVETFRLRWDTYSRPAVFACDDGSEYVVKSMQPDRPGDDAAHLSRTVVTDAVLACIGRCLGAPVPESTLVDVTVEMIALEPELREPPVFRVAPGLGHGSASIPNVGGREGIVHVDENRDRFAKLALFYGLGHASDHQMLYEDDPPHPVHSVDHGHFLGGQWTEATLAALPEPAPDPFITGACHLTDDELRAAGAALAALSDEQIAAAVALPPVAWGVAMSERVALASCLALRRSQLLAKVQ